MADDAKEHLSEYERAIYYYTIPRVTHPVPVGVLVLYLFIIIQTIIVIAYGISTAQPQWTQGGTIALALCVVVGVVTFLFRGFVHELRERSATAVAKSMPDADSQFDEIPNPFADHILLRYPVHSGDSQLSITNNKGQTLYTATLGEEGQSVSVIDHEDKPVFNAKLDTHLLSFSFETGSPSRIEVEVDGTLVARVRRRSNFGPAHVDIECMGGNPQTYEFRGGGIYCDEELVGRIYEVRKYHYLDIRKEHFRDGILGFFITIG